jgi:hypothetical protein
MDDITPNQQRVLQQEDQEKYDEKADYTVSNAGQLDTLTTGEEVEVKKWVHCECTQTDRQVACRSLAMIWRTSRTSLLP